MVDITVGAVKPTAGYEHMIQHGITGEATIAAGDGLYKGTSGTLLKALNDTQAHAALVGIALDTQATSGGAITYMPDGGSIDCTGFTEGVAVVVSNTAGKLHPVADLGTTEFFTYVGEGTSARFLIRIHATPDQLA